MALLSDHNIEGQVRLLFRVLEELEWATLLDLRLVILTDIGLSDSSSDREVWQCAQEMGMLLLTDNRNMRGPDSLEQTIREENSPTALPVLTIGSAQRLRHDRAYREACANRVAEIVVDLPKHVGTGRVFVP